MKEFTVSVKVFQHNTTLVYLNLSNINLKLKKGTRLAKALTTLLQNKHLKHLDLSYNLLCDEGVYCLCEGLQHNTTLVYLNLSNINLKLKKGTRQAKALTTMLQNKHLKHLDLSCNSLCDEGVYCLCEGLQHNTTLVYLNLSYTGITDEGVECIALANNSNRSLQLNLDVSYNYYISDKTLEDSRRNHNLIGIKLIVTNTAVSNLTKISNSTVNLLKIRGQPPTNCNKSKTQLILFPEHVLINRKKS